ncbi:hypothetical protein NEOLEDRAFT_1076408, partial [Neolentinus lepideus HHB14362 ss-1]
GDHFTAGIADFGTASFAISLALNILMTSLIAGRIYVLARRNAAVLSSRHTKQYMTIVGIILESGALFTAAQVVFLAIWHLSKAGHCTAWHFLRCIVPTLIIVRVGSGSSYENTTALGSRRPASTLVFSTKLPTNRQTRSGGATILTYNGSQSATDTEDNEMSPTKVEEV